MDVAELTGPAFTQAVHTSQCPVLVFFHKPGCTPCAKVAPHVQDMADRYGLGIQVGSLDVKAHGADVQAYSAGGTPLVVLFHEGLEVWRWRGGSVTAARMSTEVDELLANL